MSHAESGWTGWRGANRDAHVAWLPSRLAPKPNLVWRFPLREIGLAGVAATRTHVLVADRELDDTFDAFRCLDAATGKELWTYRYPAAGAFDYGNSPRATPLVVGERVFLLGATGKLSCVQLATGHLVWQRDMRLEFGVTEEMPWGACGSPLFVEGKLIVNPGGAEASLVALDAATGNTLWRTPGRPAAYGSFIAAKLGGKLQIVGHDQTTLGGWDVATGVRLWTIEPPSSKDFNVSTPLVHGNHLIVITDGNPARVFRFQDQGAIVEEPLATFAALRCDTHTPVVVGNRLFGVSRRLFCLDLAKPLSVVYEGKDSSLRSHTSLIASQDRLLVSNEAGELLLIDARADEFKLLGKMQVFDDEQGLLSHPALVDKRLYLRGSREIVCIDLADGG